MGLGPGPGPMAYDVGLMSNGLVLCPVALSYVSNFLPERASVPVQQVRKCLRAERVGSMIGQ